MIPKTELERSAELELYFACRRALGDLRSKISALESFVADDAGDIKERLQRIGEDIAYIEEVSREAPEAWKV